MERSVSKRPMMLYALDQVYIVGSKVRVYYNEDMYYDVIRQLMNRTDKPQLTKDRFGLEKRALLLEPSNFFYEIFDRKLQQYIEADLINYNTKRWKNDNDPRKCEVDKEPFAVLTLAELEAGFVVSLVPLALSILVFGLEWMVFLKEPIFIRLIFKTLFRVKDHEQIVSWQECLTKRKLRKWI